MAHQPVLLNEVLAIFDPQPGQVYIDATVNGGGHALEILKRVGSTGTVLGIDWDCELVNKLKVKSEKSKIGNLKLICDNYVRIRTLARKYNLDSVNGILFDLGFSSYHLEESKRGFSFLRDEILDMRYNPDENNLTAKEILNSWPRPAIETILQKYGEERYAKRIAQGVVSYRGGRKKIERTTQLVGIIENSVPRSYLKSRIHPATRTFQALRIAVNSELDNLAGALEDGLSVVDSGGKIAVISFHSLEDRVVKRFFKAKSDEGLVRILTKKPLGPTAEELKNNPRARSAKLRVVEKF